MSLSQNNKVSPPLDIDAKSLRDFASVVQDSFDRLYEAAHRHAPRTVEPTIADGKPGDMVGVVLGTDYYLYYKFPIVGWKRILFS